MHNGKSILSSTVAVGAILLFATAHADIDPNLKSICQTFDDCRVACGSASYKYKCHPQGYCSCVGKYMPINRCFALDKKDMKCQNYCSSFPDAEIRRCKTTKGRICSCFVYSEDK